MLIDHLAIIGVGLIGGSLARALRKAKLVNRVSACNRSETTLKKAVELGVIDDYSMQIDTAIADADVVVIGDDGTHFEARIVSDQFEGLSMVKQHQIVYKTLGEKMGTDIHALSFQTYTPEQWENKG